MSTRCNDVSHGFLSKVISMEIFSAAVEKPSWSLSETKKASDQYDTPSHGKLTSKGSKKTEHIGSEVLLEAVVAPTDFSVFVR
jgi:hypothetical protein